MSLKRFVELNCDFCGKKESLADGDATKSYLLGSGWVDLERVGFSFKGQFRESVNKHFCGEKHFVDWIGNFLRTIDPKKLDVENDGELPVFTDVGGRK